MFSVDRYDPSSASGQDKQSRLSSFNERLKRKRSKVEPASPARSTTEQGTSMSAEEAFSEQPTVESTTDDSIRKPHREKKVKQKPTGVPETIDTDLGQGKVSHILKTFHKIQDRAGRIAEPENNDDELDVEPQIEVADLVPVPQAGRTNVKRPTISVAAGLPEYLRHPHMILSVDKIPFESLPLCKKIQDNLRKCEFENAFAVQATLLPVLLKPHLPEVRQDLLVSAPTGSGKTLTYVLPILQTLQARVVTRLRALVIVPTRELVQQVQSTFESLSSKLGLQIETLSATRPFATEQALLVNDYEPTAPSNVDILICTPGRLVDHIKSTPRFTLRDLRFLVIDEGDRLLNQSFQGWSEQIDEALKPLADAEEVKFDMFKTRSKERCQKLIFSATLSTDPSLLAQLNLIKPALYLVQHSTNEDEDEVSISKFTTPATLDEFFVHVPESVAKPLVLLTAVHKLDVPKALVFTNTNESAIKLAALMSRLNIGRCEAITSTLTPAMRRRHFADFNNTNENEIKFLVCSDLMARGIDTTVTCVLNYDSSISVRQYIHRVGRTARAGKHGRAVSLVEGGESKYWWNQIGKKVKRIKPVQRVTLFPKPEKRNIEAGSAEEGKYGQDQQMRDAETEEQAVEEASAPRDQIELRVVDMDDLRITYESALADLQRGGL